MGTVRVLRACLLLALPGALTGVSVAWAQQEEEAPGIMVVSQNICEQEYMSEMFAMSDTTWFPILDELVEEDQLLNWGIMTHQWGDEWNYVAYYRATDNSAFFEAFNEAVRRFNQRYPGLIQQTFKFCSRHKDNIYTIRRMR